jgi:hypothetical protein
MSEDHYSKYNFVAFNISKTDGSGVSYNDRYAFRIYVPKDIQKEPTVMTQEDRDYLTSNGLNPDDYDKLDLDYTLFAYYYSTSTGSTLLTVENNTATNFAEFVGTRLISKAEMPVGSIIRVDSGYQYRPEKFADLENNAAVRGENTKTAHTVVDDAWWGSDNYVGFNISIVRGNKIVNAETGTHFAIYVPKA